VRNFILCAGSVLALMAGSAPVVGDDDFPIAGTYLQNAKCKGDGTDRADLLVKITRKDIESNMGFCAILHVRREGKAISLQVECKVPSGHVILGDVMFTPRDEGTLDFEDQDHTSSAVLYRCGP
jgi:hypothetical protein